MAFCPQASAYGSPANGVQAQAETRYKGHERPRARSSSTPTPARTTPSRSSSPSPLPELEVLGITAVAGNVPLRPDQRNARMIVELAGKPTPGLAGCDRPLVRPLVTAEHVHGKTGLDGIDPARADPCRCARIHARRLHHRHPAGARPRHDHALPARAADQHRHCLPPRARHRPRVPEIVLMGGGYFEGGNITPAAEFNIYVDPEAADVVFQCGRAGRRDAARRHPQGADHARVGRALPRPRHAGRRSRSPTGSISSSASTTRNTAATAPRCTTPA